jgi:hypothetical protein
MGSASERMRSYRSRLRAKGLRPAQLWVYDEKDPAFQDELRRGIATWDRTDEREVTDFIERMFDWDEAA